DFGRTRLNRGVVRLYSGQLASGVLDAGQLTVRGALRRSPSQLAREVMTYEVYPHVGIDIRDLDSLRRCMGSDIGNPGGIRDGSDRSRNSWRESEPVSAWWKR